MISVFFVEGFTKVNFNKSKLDRNTVSRCPEIKRTDILLIHGFMLKMSTNPETKAKINTGSYFKIDKEKFESYSKQGDQTLKLFEEYWKEKGVERVANPQKCEKIYESLKNNYSKKSGENIREIFYEVKNKYIVLYSAKEVKGTGSKVYPQPIILDEEFKLVEN